MISNKNINIISFLKVKSTQRKEHLNNFSRNCSKLLRTLPRPYRDQDGRQGGAGLLRDRRKQHRAVGEATD